MVTDMRRARVQGVRDTSGPVTFVLGMGLVLVGIAGFLAVGRTELLGLSVTMPLGVLRLTLGTVLVAAVILGPRPARVTAAGSGLTLLALAVAGLAGVTQVAPTGADIALYLVLGIALTAAGRP
jgi:hypothetical protein